MFLVKDLKNVVKISFSRKVSCSSTISNRHFVNNSKDESEKKQLFEARRIMQKGRKEGPWDWQPLLMENQNDKIAYKVWERNEIQKKWHARNQHALQKLLNFSHPEWSDICWRFPKLQDINLKNVILPRMKGLATIFPKRNIVNLCNRCPNLLLKEPEHWLSKIQQFELIVRMTREEVVDIVMRQPNVLFNDWEKTTLPKILFMKQFYGVREVKKGILDEPTLLKRSWYRLSRIKFINERPDGFGPWNPFHVVKWNWMVMNDTFPDYRDYLIRRCTPFMPHKVKQFDHWTIEQLEEANGKLTQLRFERDFDWNIFDRDGANLSVPVKKAMKAKAKAKIGQSDDLKLKIKQEMIDVLEKGGRAREKSENAQERLPKKHQRAPGHSADFYN